MTASNPSQDGASPVPEEIESLIQKYLDEDLDAEGFARLQVRMKNDPAVRRRYLAASESVVLLRETAGRLASKDKGEGEPAATATRLQPYLWLPALAAGVVLLMAALAYRSFALPRIGARLVGSTEANWLSPPVDQGRAVRLGTQLQLASGSIELEFKSGASTRIHGPHCSRSNRRTVACSIMEKPSRWQTMRARRGSRSGPRPAPMSTREPSSSPKLRLMDTARCS